MEKLPFAHEKPTDSTGLLLWQVTTIWQKEISAALRPYGLTQVQFVLLAGLLWLLEKETLVSQAMLAKHTKLDAMMTSQVLRLLESRKLIERRLHPTDMRAKSIFLTESGKEAVCKAIPVVEKIDANFFSLEKGKRQLFNKVLRKLAAP